jgi:hypothetical protein
MLIEDAALDVPHDPPPLLLTAHPVVVGLRLPGCFSRPATSFGFVSYATIQDAVNHVNTGATVNIAGGTHPEHQAADWSASCANRWD